MSYSKIVMIALSVMLVSGCAGNKPKPADTAKPAGAESGASSTGVGQGSVTATPMDGSASGTAGDADLLQTHVIYFDYDSAQIKSEFVDVVNAHGRYLADHAGARIRLEGHADERGTREYNVALSEYRAQAVANLMKFQGVRPGQVETVAYGEEKPAVLGHNEAAWSRNRRVEIVYEAR
ncbi:MAG: peptidoglycan-associated lipoprotein Pal [bacterium]